jgi:hypothetical protein
MVGLEGQLRPGGVATGLLGRPGAHDHGAAGLVAQDGGGLGAEDAYGLACDERVDVGRVVALGDGRRHPQQGGVLAGRGGGSREEVVERRRRRRRRWRSPSGRG